ncbi:MAG: hypothetical protein ABEJ64_01275 [Candidatus Nanohaloarchaea archaeon]
MDLGEVPCELPGRSSYDTHEELWEGMGIDPQVEELRSEWGLDRVEYPEQDPLLNGRS